MPPNVAAWWWPMILSMEAPPTLPACLSLRTAGLSRPRPARMASQRRSTAGLCLTLRLQRPKPCKCTLTTAGIRALHWLLSPTQTSIRHVVCVLACVLVVGLVIVGGHPTPNRTAQSGKTSSYGVNLEDEAMFKVPTVVEAATLLQRKRDEISRSGVTVRC